MSETIAALVHAALLARREDTNSSDAAPALPPVSNDYPYPYSPLQHTGFFILFFFPAVALIVVALRVYSRVSTKQFGWDDGLICFAMAESVAETIASYFGMRYAFLGVHVYDIPLQADSRLGFQWNYIIQLLYNPILALVKTSMLMFLLRLSGQKRSVRLAIIGLNVFNIALMIAIFFTIVFQCQPISYFWEKAGRNPPKDGKCIDTGAFYVSTAALTIFTDVVFLALPFWIFLGLNMPARVKIALLAVFALGAIVTVVSILRLLWLIEISYHINVQDPTYDIRFTLSAVETNLAIITASAPALRGLFLRWFPKLFASIKASRARYGQTTDPAKKSRVMTTTTASNHVDTFKLKSMKGREIRSHSPTMSEEEIMTYDGIMRTTEVDIVHDDQRDPVLPGTREPMNRNETGPGRTNYAAKPYPITHSGMF
ncbi:CFEM domain-containing protein [Colletotrichum graminicola]|uniref:CFEM domain-containing protein n=1 Tax=Colletotrichum graminicola (strain M1.001 / M2 / FGSC 10212) TaxID=645133 RepID=E3QAW0_COLGM|nr:CFEM domain-containing protein [Colletotrichum graminicola M1.001]EFQ27998.1 CFEM domain-containing protein [Colletotrichum graminicola M1.001]WDK12053.1 CFEM domain-containing protein [Colletotrichum graminicola]